MGEILALRTDEKALIDDAASIKKALKEATYEASRLIHSIEAPRTPEIHSEHTIELPKIYIPTFDGNILNWVTFWEQFEIAIHLNKKLHDVQKFRGGSRIGEKGSPIGKWRNAKINDTHDPLN